MQEYYPDWWDEWQKRNLQRKLMVWHVKDNAVMVKTVIVLIKVIPILPLVVKK